MTQAPMTIRICHLYPRLLSVAGDRGNLLALIQALRLAGDRCERDRGRRRGGPRLRAVRPDLAAWRPGPGDDRRRRSDLAVKAGPLREAIEAGAVVLAVCAGYQLLGQYYAPADGPPITGNRRARRGNPGRPDPLHEPHRGRVRSRPGQAGTSSSAFENHSGRTYLGPAHQAAWTRARRIGQQRGGRHGGRPVPGGLRHLPARPGAAEEPLAGRPPALPCARASLPGLRPARRADGPGGGPRA